MTTEILPSADVAAGGSAEKRPSDWLRPLASRLATRLDTWADHWAAAAMYQQLSRLSDAELARRGLSRATLARDVAATTPHRNQPNPEVQLRSLSEAVSLGCNGCQAALEARIT